MRKEQTLERQIRWNKLKWALPFLAVFLPIILLSVYSFKVASSSVRDLVESQNFSAVSSLSQLINQDMSSNLRLANALASVTGTTTAVERRDDVALRTRLKAIIVSNSQIHRAFVVDTDGKLWSEYPVADGAYGSSVADTRWFKELQGRWKPVVSEVYIRPQFPKQPVVAIAMPIFSTTSGASADIPDEPVGVLVFEYRVRPITDWLKNIQLGNAGHLYVVDHLGNVVAHPEIEIAGALRSDYKDVTQVQEGLGGTLQTTEYRDPIRYKNMIASFTPLAVGTHVWVVVAQQETEIAYALLNRVKLNISVAGLILTLFTITLVLGLANMSSKNIRLNTELELKNQTLKDFTSIVSHQLKAPITAMRWTIEGMLDGDYGDLNTEMREALKQLHEVNISNNQLIMNILNISRLDRGVVSVETKKEQLRDIVQRAIRDYVPAAKKAGLYLKTDEMDADILVEADLEKTAESITNSISNAIKHTKSGGITVTMKKAADKGVITVTDTGEGMTEEMLQKLFTRDRVQSKSASAAGSSGLGLYIAKKFMELQGGDIGVESVVGKGTTFTYTLPLAKN